MVAVESKLICGDTLTELKKMPDNSVDMCITSPPYYGLRDYKLSPQVWDEDKNCHHEWGNEIIIPAPGGIPKCDTNIGYWKKQQEDGSFALKGKPRKSNFCLKCNAWQGSLGLEPIFDLYLKHLLQITAEIKRVLKPTGSFWLNLGDCFSNSGKGAGSEIYPKSKQTWAFTEKDKKICANCGKEFEGWAFQNFCSGACAGVDNTPRKENGLLSSKCMLMMPERIALAMIDQQGWILRNKIRWIKQILIKKENRTIGSVMPSSVKDRFNESGEELYFFTKSRKYYFDLDSVRIPNQVLGVTDFRASGLVRSAELYPNSKYAKAEGQGKIDGRVTKHIKFNYRVRDAKKKSAQCPQFKATEEEIKKYAPADHRGVNDTTDKNYGLKRNWRAEEKQGYEMGSVDPHRAALRGGLKLRNKVNDPRGNHEGGPGSWRDFKDENDNFTNPQGKNLPSCWLIGSEPHNFSKEFNVDTDHFATFPQALVEIPILAGSPEFVCGECKRPIKIHLDKQIKIDNQKYALAKGCRCDTDKVMERAIVLDPFCGSGTTGVVAKKLGRNFLGIDLNRQYLEIAQKRIDNTMNSLF